MGTRYLTDMAAVLRAQGLWVIEDPGWEFRSRSSGGYSNDRPTHVMWHHTASSAKADGRPDVDYICRGSADRPLSNLYLQRNGAVTCCAGGATNTNGKGHDYWGGGVPDDSMNLYAIGVEIGNDGVGEQYTEAQVAAIQKIAVGLSRAYGIPVGKHRGHLEWAPGRKIDPAGPPSPWMNPSDSSRRWNMDQFRASVYGWLNPVTPPTPIPTPPKPVEVIAVADQLQFISGGTRYDTRVYGAPMPAGQYDIGFDGAAGKKGVLVNLTITQATADGYATAWRGDTPAPDKSSVNYVKGGTICNQVSVPITAGGLFKVYISSPAHIVADCDGHWV